MSRHAAAVAAALTIGAAHAADLPNGQASPGLLRGESAYNWSGVYAGATAGMGFAEVLGLYSRPLFGTPKPHGFAAGLGVGFNRQAGSLVVGLEADFTLSNAQDSVSRTASGRYGDYALSGAGKIESTLVHVGTVRPRVGYAIDNVLLYATGGYAFARSRMSMSGSAVATALGFSGTPAQAGTTSNMQNGWVVGGGVEYAFARGTSLKIEYLRLHFTESSFLNSWASQDVKSNINLIRGGLNFRI